MGVGGKLQVGFGMMVRAAVMFMKDVDEINLCPGAVQKSKLNERGRGTSQDTGPASLSRGVACVCVAELDGHLREHVQDSAL